MPCTREQLERRERETLAPWAQFSAETRGRVHRETPPDWRTHYQRDRDRVIHSRAFRRLEYKTQVFINYRENNRLAEPQLNFSAFGKVVEGMDVVEKFVQVGDPSGGLDQGRLWADGGNYLASLPVKPTMIEKATVVE